MRSLFCVYSIHCVHVFSCVFCLVTIVASPTRNPHHPFTMRLVKIVTIDGHTVETARECLRHFTYFQRLIEAREKRTPPDMERPFPIPIARNHVHMLLAWGAMEQRVPVNPALTMQLMRDTMTAEERLFMIGRPDSELKEYALLAVAVDSQRLMMMASLMNTERETDTLGVPSRVWAKQTVAMRRRAFDDREEQLHRRRLQRGRTRYDRTE